MVSVAACVSLGLASVASAANPFRAQPCMISYNVREEPNALAVGDIDGDGLDDVVVGGKVDHVISWYRSNGTAFVSQGKLIAKEVLKPTTVSVVDLDGDGDLDVVAGTPLTSWSHDVLTAYHRVYAFLNGGRGESWATVELTHKGVSGVHSVRGGDVDGDGVADVVVGSQSSSTAIWLRGKTKKGGYGSKGSRTIVAGDAGIHLAQPYDVDGDGDLDVVTCSDTDAFRWFENGGGGADWSEHVLDAGEGDDDPYKGGGSRFSCHVDLDGDGFLDLVEANKYAADGEGLRSSAWNDGRRLFFKFIRIAPGRSSSVGAGTGTGATRPSTRSASSAGRRSSSASPARTSTATATSTSSRTTATRTKSPSTRTSAPRPRGT